MTDDIKRMLLEKSLQKAQVAVLERETENQRDKNEIAALLEEATGNQDLFGKHLMKLILKSYLADPLGRVCFDKDGSLSGTIQLRNPRYYNGRKFELACIYNKSKRDSEEHIKFFKINDTYYPITRKIAIGELKTLSALGMRDMCGCDEDIIIGSLKLEKIKNNAKEATNGKFENDFCKFFFDIEILDLLKKIYVMDQKNEKEMKDFLEEVKKNTMALYQKIYQNLNDSYGRDIKVKRWSTVISSDLPKKPINDEEEARTNQLMRICNEFSGFLRYGGLGLGPRKNPVDLALLKKELLKDRVFGFDSWSLSDDGTITISFDIPKFEYALVHMDEIENKKEEEQDTEKDTANKGKILVIIPVRN